MASGTTKLNQLRELLAQGIATLHLDARHEGVRVPLALRVHDNLHLNVSYRYASVQLHLDTEDVCATLSFDGKPYRCVIPWDAVFGVTAAGNKGQVWLEDVPLEVRLRIAEQVEHAAAQRRPRRAQLVN